LFKADTQPQNPIEPATEHRYKSGIIMSNKYTIEGNGAVPQSKYRRDAPLFGGAITTDLPKEFIDAR